ncbi:peroxidase 7 [Prosopis cineraria]|uniref:peroxidase 7 n=1 Tax=Prosopis cineraria TaxID=364024 RepID=UPI00240FEC74|nr:peroxidase 7 [Prosopis cineraria]
MSFSFTCFLLLLLLAFYSVLASAKSAESYAHNGGEDKKYNSSRPDEGDDNKEHSSSPPEGSDDDDGAIFTLEAPNLEETILENLLSFGHYRKTCAQFESIVHRKVNEWVKKDRTLGASLMRLHFHDCIVRGCDASVLLNHETSERRANASKTLRGFEVIDEIKGELEKQCPKTVSCADILTAATRDATVALGGPYWAVPYGRKDGRVSIAEEAETVPMGHEDITSLLELFQSKGLNVLDLVVLSGAHTTGRASCGCIQDRIFNYKGTQKPDPSIDPKYLDFLQRKCRWSSEYVYLDAITPTTFDPVYYLNLKKKMALLSTDQMLYSDSRTLPLVSALVGTTSSLFNHQFAVSMAKLGNVGVLTDEDDGEIRTNCNYVNAY